MSVTLFNRQLPVNFRYAPLATAIAPALQYVAKGHERTLAPQCRRVGAGRDHDNCGLQICSPGGSE